MHGIPEAPRRFVLLLCCEYENRFVISVAMCVGSDRGPCLLSGTERICTQGSSLREWCSFIQNHIVLVPSAQVMVSSGSCETIPECRVATWSRPESAWVVEDSLKKLVFFFYLYMVSGDRS